jgi:solute carrier family 25 S-adenosylmethionine transporter 26
MMECAKDILKHKGIGGLYNGYMSFIMREIPFSSIQFPFYEILKMTQIRLIAYGREKSLAEVELPYLINAFNGALAGSFAGFTVTPFDVLKTRLMTLSVKEVTPSTAQVFKEIISEEGIRGLYRGAMMRMIYLGVGGSAFFGIYEEVKRTLTSSSN